jgi:hypothetical protein
LASCYGCVASQIDWSFLVVVEFHSASWWLVDLFLCWRVVSGWCSQSLSHHFYFAIWFVLRVGFTRLC